MRNFEHLFFFSLKSLTWDTDVGSVWWRNENPHDHSLFSCGKNKEFFSKAPPILISNPPHTPLSLTSS
jgi:hypothetical protein